MYGVLAAGWHIELLGEKASSSAGSSLSLQSIGHQNCHDAFCEELYDKIFGIAGGRQKDEEVDRLGEEERDKTPGEKRKEEARDVSPELREEAEPKKDRQRAEEGELGLVDVSINAAFVDSAILEGILASIKVSLPYVYI